MIIGIQYYRPPTPPVEEFKKDLIHIRSLGFEAIKIWVYWGWHEVSPDCFVWDDVDYLFDLSEDVGLKIVPNLIMEAPPSWFEPQYPLQSPRGVVRRMHFIGTACPCFDDPTVIKAGTNFIRQAVRRYHNRLALLLWDAWNEPRSRNECICPASKKSFKSWLAKQYGNINNFNQIFGKRYHSFDAVPMVGYGNEYSVILNYRLWAAESVRNRVKWVADIVREEDPCHEVMTHAGGCSVIQSVIHDTNVDALTAKVVDFYGISFPVFRESQSGVKLSQRIEEQRYLGPMMLDWTRSISKRFWVSELYSNRAGAWRKLSPRELCIQFWQAIAYGAEGIFFWQFKPERLGSESLGYGLVDIVGCRTERSQYIQKVLQHVNRNKDFYSSLQPAKANVCIIYDERSDIISEAETKYFPEVGNLYKLRLHTIYELFMWAGIPVAFVPRQDIERIKKFSLLYLVGNNVMDGALIEHISEFIRSGGTIIAEPGLGIRRENSWISSSVPPEKLVEIFGIKEKQRKTISNPRSFTGLDRFPSGEFCNFIVELQEISCERLASWEDGGDAVTISSVNTGKAIYLAGFPDFKNPNKVDWFKKFLKYCGISPPVKYILEGDQTSVYIRQAFVNKKPIYFIFNYGGKSVALLFIEPKPESLDVVFNAKLLGDKVLVPAADVSIVQEK